MGWILERGVSEVFETVKNPHLKEHCINFSFNEELAILFGGIAEKKYSHTPFVLTYDFSNKEYQRILFKIQSHCNSGVCYKDVAWVAYWGNEVVDYACGIGEKEAYDAAIKILEGNTSEINNRLNLNFEVEQLSLF